jgi:succinyl-diaminopimelate desuccinylase
MSGGDMPNMIPGKCTVTIQFSAEYEKVLLSGLEEIACESRSVEYEVSSDPDENDEMKKLVVRVTGKTAHASLPDDGDNAILKAGKLIKQIFDNINIQDEFIDFFARRFGDKTDGSLYGCALYDKLSGALTFSSGIINMSEGNLEIIVDIRYPVSYCEVDVLKKISGTSEIEGVQIKRINGMAPIYFPEDHPFVLHLSNTYNTVTGDHAKPLTTGGGTYARKMPNTLAFGPVFPGKEEVFHVAGEYIDIEDLNICAKIYKEALLKISQLAYQNETVKEN